MWYVRKAWDHTASDHAGEHGDDHWLSWAVKSHGGKVQREKRFRWSYHPVNRDVCVSGLPMLSQHKISSGEVYQWDKKWKEMAPTAHACRSGVLGTSDGDYGGHSHSHKSFVHTDRRGETSPDVEKYVEYMKADGKNAAKAKKVSPFKRR
jgi:hypothetical protein